MTRLRDAAENYLRVRRTLGFKLQRSGQLLLQFVDYAERQGADRVTPELAVAWATLPADTDPNWWAARLKAVRTFAVHQHAIDAETVVPPADLLPYRTGRAEPFLYTEAEIAALQRAATISFLSLKAATYETLIGLLAVTGMRVGEAIRLDRDDIDWQDGLITIRDSKFGKTRCLPLHPTTVSELHDYDQIRDQRYPARSTDAFFVSIRGTRLIYQNVHEAFHRLTQHVGLAPRSASCRPRIHDLRHRFAVLTLAGWYQTGVDIDRHLHLLSTYLGHGDPSSTYWYLTATPELLGLAADRLATAREALP